MKVFLILLALGLTASEKLDRTYLPPPGAKFAGGSPGAILGPLELPKETYQTNGLLLSENGLPTLGDSQIKLGISRGLPESGQGTTTKAPFKYYTENVPVTTTSYAFTQTTTLPPTVYETTSVQINPVTGLPEQYSTQNLDNSGFSPVFGQNKPNLQSFGQDQRLSSPVSSQLESEQRNVEYAKPGYSHSDIQLLGQYQDQYPTAVVPGSKTQTGDVFQQPIQQVPVYGQNLPQEISIPSTVTPQSSLNFQPGSKFNSNIGSPVVPINSQTILPEQQNQGQSLQPSQASFDQNQYERRNPSQQYRDNQDSIPISEYSKDYQPGSSSTVPENFSEPSYSSTTPLPRISSTVIPKFVYKLPERPQTESERRAVILNYQNDRTPYGYSYSYDTSNGIHADESGIVDNGTKAKGGYSYISDDGKVYSITYTADENGFQPRGDHLPTPPPIPEAIQKVIDQVAREEDAGVSDDGSYDEEKYGDKKYQGKIDRYNSPNLNFDETSSQGIGTPNSRRKTISRISNVIPDEQVEGIRKDQYDDINNEVNDGSRDDKTSTRGNLNIVKETNQIGAPVAGVTDTSLVLNTGSEKQIPFERRPNQKGTVRQYPESQVSYSNFNKDSVPETNINNLETIGFNDLQNQRFVNRDLTNRPGEITIQGYDNISSSNQMPIKDSGTAKESRLPVLNSRYTETQNANSKLVQKESYDGNEKHTDLPESSFNADEFHSDKPTSNQEGESVKNRYNQNFDDKTGYSYNRPQTKFESNRFSTRFRGQEPSSTMKPDQYGISTKGTTLKPFMASYVQNKEDDSRQAASTRKPFVTVDVASPTTEQGQRVDGQRFDYTRGPIEKLGTTARPYVVKQTPEPNQYTPSSERTRVTQSGRPGLKTSDYSVISTTPMPSSNSRFGITGTTQKPTIRFQQRTTNTNAVSNYGNRPTSRVPSMSGLISHEPGYSTTRPAFASRLPSANRVTPQSYPTSTTPAAIYSTLSPGFEQSSATPGTYQPSYQYGYSGPISSYGSKIPTSRPTLIPSGPGMYSEVAPGSSYQSDYPYHPIDFFQSSSGPIRTETDFQTGISKTTPAMYQTGYPYRTATGAPIIVGKSTPGYFVSETPVRGTPQTYSTTTYRPEFIIQGQYTQSPGINVDNFGRPINSEDAIYPGYSSSNTGLPSYSEDNKEQNPKSTQGLTSENMPGSVHFSRKFTYPGYGTTERVIGEDFSGPKQPQKFDPKTGYHY